MIYFPPIRLNAGSTSNNLFGVQIQAEEFGSGQSWVGVLAQEVFECRYSWAHLPGALFGGTKFHEQMELFSHTVEAVVASALDGRDFAAYSELMLNLLDDPHGYRSKYNYFQGMTREDLRAAMKGYYAQALSWATANKDYFAKWKLRRFARV